MQAELLTYKITWSDAHDEAHIVVRFGAELARQYINAVFNTPGCTLLRVETA